MAPSVHDPDGLRGDPALVQKPRCIRRGKDWAEFLLGHLEELVFEVRRFAFTSRMENDTQGEPHVLSVAEGKAVLIQPFASPERAFRLGFSETAIVPACVGKYSIRNLGAAPCKVLKTIVNPSGAAGSEKAG